MRIRLIFTFFFIYSQFLGILCKSKQSYGFERRGNNIVLNECLNNQTNAVYKAIAACESQSLISTANCIKDKMFSSLAEYWDVWVQNQNNTQSAIQIWAYNDCFIKLNNYGKFSRNYLLWFDANKSVLKDQARVSQKSFKNLKFFSQKSTNVNNLDCQNFKTQAVAKAVDGCQNYFGLYSISSCITKELFRTLKQTWDVHVIEKKSSNQALAYWENTGCSFQLDNFGSKKLFYTIWRTIQ